MFNMAKFSDRLGDIMFDKDTSTAALSKAVGVSKSTIYRYLKGQRVPETEILIRIADYFHCTIDFLLGLEETIMRDLRALVLRFPNALFFF